MVISAALKGFGMYRNNVVFLVFAEKKLSKNRKWHQTLLLYKVFHGDLRTGITSFLSIKALRVLMGTAALKRSNREVVS